MSLADPTPPTVALPPGLRAVALTEDAAAQVRALLDGDGPTHEGREMPTADASALEADSWGRRIHANILAGRLDEAGQKADADFDGGRVKPLRYRDSRSRGVGNNPKGVRPDLTPTHHLPGSEGKIRVLEERARLGQALWHPEDGRGLPRDDAHDDNADTEE